MKEAGYLPNRLKRYLDSIIYMADRTPAALSPILASDFHQW
jgi:hypothetical protein